MAMSYSPLMIQKSRLGYKFLGFSVLGVENISGPAFSSKAYFTSHEIHAGRNYDSNNKLFNT